MEKYYRILDLPTNASEQEVKQAYRELVKVWHPDRFTHDVKLQKKAEEKLKEINDAYQRIIDHLNNSYAQQQSQQSQKTEKKEKPDRQPPPKQPHNSWICPECLRTNYMDSLSCGCGFRTNSAEIETYKADRTSVDLYDAVIFNRSMNYTDRANFLARYLLIRFPNSKEAELIKKGTQSATVPKKTKSNKLRHLKKNWGWYLVLGVIVFVIISSALNPEPARKQTPVLNEPPQKSEPIFTEPIQPLPINGAIKRYVDDEAIAPLKITTRESGNHYFVKIVDWHTNKLVCTVFIRSGQSVNLDVPIGTYKLKYATGEQWYGTKFLFGPETSYSVADKRFDFEIRGDHVSGYTVELYPQPHGNLRITRISANEF
ncbi:MAG: J domain-containing protein [Candidatus Aenigmatarchaeota archaeon]